MHKIELPKRERDPKRLKELCTCRPTCKSRRRMWKKAVQVTSAELALERKPVDECIKMYPKKVYHNSPCPMFAKTPYVHTIERGVIIKPTVVRICQAPIDEEVDVTYLKMYELAKKLGAVDLVKDLYKNCECCGCCPCIKGGYVLHDPERETSRRKDMRSFDDRVKEESKVMRIMYK